MTWQLITCLCLVRSMCAGLFLTESKWNISVPLSDLRLYVMILERVITPARVIISKNNKILVLFPDVLNTFFFNQMFIQKKILYLLENFQIIIDLQIQYLFYVNYLNGSIIIKELNKTFLTINAVFHWKPRFRFISVFQFGTIIWRTLIFGWKRIFYVTMCRKYRYLCIERKHSKFTIKNTPEMFESWPLK